MEISGSARRIITEIMGKNLIKKFSFFAVFVFCFFLLLYGFFFKFQQNAFLYLLLALCLIICLILIFILALFRPAICLALAIILLYNPYYLYLLFTNFWSYASFRIGISSFFIFIFALSILLKGFLRGNVNKLKTPLDTPLVIFLIFPIIATASGFIQGNSARLILSDLFPMLEFVSFFFITTLVIKNDKEVSFLLKVVLAWLVLIELCAIIFYIFNSKLFAYGATPAGITVNRLPEFMAVISLALLMGSYFYPRVRKEGSFNRKRLLILFFSFIPLMSLFLGFFRSLWLAVAGGSVFIFLMICRYKMKLKSILIFFFLFIILFFLFDIMIISKTDIFQGKTLSFLIFERAFHILGKESHSLSVQSRLEEAPRLLNIIYGAPLIGIGFGNPLTISTSNYYLRMASTMGLPVLFFLFWIAILFMTKGIKKFHKADWNSKGWILGILASFVSVALVILTFPALLHFPIFAYLGILMACLFFFSNEKDYGRIH